MGVYGWLLALTVAIITLRTFLPTKNNSRLPPGPKRKPIIGNLLDLPAAGVQEWRHWLEHKEKYGIGYHFATYIHLFGSPLTIARTFEFHLDFWNDNSDYQ
jgi:hypothetical protein